MMYRILIAFFAVCLLSCSKNPLDPKNPVTVTFWHPYGQQMKISMETLVEEFNNTVGAKSGIFVQTDYVADASLINERLLLATSDDPGAPEFPDIAVIYPRVAVSLAKRGLLTDLSTLLKENELSEYISYFLEEGKLGEDTLYLLPIAKSTEILYVNNTIFERFAKDTGVTLSQLSTIEGLIDAAHKYHTWSGGKAFLHYVDLFNYAMIGFQQLDEEFVVNNSLNLQSPVFSRIWDNYFPPAAVGSVAVFNGYGNYLMAAGEAVCVIGTSASITFYPKSVTYADNTKEDCDLILLPYPVFRGGRRVAMQRGAGIAVIKSEYKREYACGVFIKWLTAPEQNLRFTSDTGYMPVTTSAFRDFYSTGQESVTDENVKKLIQTITEMQKEYSFYYPPVFDGFEEMQKSYSQSMLQAAENARRDGVTRGAMERFILEAR